MALPAQAAELSAKEIVDKALDHNFFGFKQAEVDLKMDLIAPNGSLRKRRLNIRSYEDEAGLSHTLARFLEPADVAGTTFLVHENKEGDDSQFLYLPAFGKVKRITAGQKNQRFMGTDFTYGDMQTDSLKGAALTRLPDQKLSGQNVYVVEAIPQNGKEAQYSKTVAFIHPATFIPMMLEFYAKKSGEKVKELKVFNVKKIDNQWVIMKAEVRDLTKGSHTTLEIVTIDTTAKMTPEDFSQAAMTR